MRKTCIFNFLVCVIFLGGHSFSGESEKEVVVEGYAFVRGFPDAAVIELARESARRRAIEVAGETVIERHSETENFQLVRDCVIVDVKGLIKKQDWLLYPNDRDYEVRDDRLFVKLKAVVRVGRIDNDLPAIAEMLRIKGQPRVMTLIREEAGTGQDHGVIAAEVENLFIDKGFRMLDPSIVADIGDRERDELFDDPDRAAAVVRRLPADYVIVGVVRAAQEEPYEDEGVRMSRSQLTIRFSVVDNHLGGKLAQVQQAFHTRPGRAENAANQLQTALTTVGKNIAPELLAKVLDKLGRQTGFIEIVAGNADRGKLDRLRESLLKMGGRQNFVTRSMRQGQAVAELESQFNIDAVASYIEEQSDAPLILESQLESKLICTFK